MRRAAICLAAVGLFSLIGSAALAGDQAATSERPAALQALGVSPTEILSAEQAGQVRGEGYRPFWVGGGVFVHNYVAYGVVYIESAQPTSVSILLSPVHFGFWIDP